MSKMLRTFSKKEKSSNKVLYDRKILRDLKFTNRPPKVPPINHVNGYHVTPENLKLSVEKNMSLPVTKDEILKRRSLDSIYTDVMDYTNSTNNKIKNDASVSEYSYSSSKDNVYDLYQNSESTRPPSVSEMTDTIYTCSICFSNTTKQIVYLECGHFVHTSCMVNFLLKNSKEYQITSKYIDNQKCQACFKVIQPEDIQCILTKSLRKCKNDLIQSKNLIQETEHTIQELDKTVKIQVDYSKKLESNKNSIEKMIVCIRE